MSVITDAEWARALVDEVGRLFPDGDAAARAIAQALSDVRAEAYDEGGVDACERARVEVGRLANDNMRLYGAVAHANMAEADAKVRAEKAEGALREAVRSAPSPELRDEMVEAMAKASWGVRPASFDGVDEPWDGQRALASKETCRKRARAALSVVRPLILEEATTAPPRAHDDGAGLDIAEVTRDRAELLGRCERAERMLNGLAGRVCAALQQAAGGADDGRINTALAFKVVHDVIIRAAPAVPLPCGKEFAFDAATNTHHMCPLPYEHDEPCGPARPVLPTVATVLVPCSVCGTPAPMPEAFRVYCGDACADKAVEGTWRAP